MLNHITNYKDIRISF